MERHAMIVAGFGFRTGADTEALADALAATGAHPDALATAADKAATLASLAARLGLPLHAVPLHDLDQPDAAPSPHAPARYHGRSLAEASALAAAGPGARLILRRVASPCGTATCALAERTDP
jgi:cobalt-precorrin 5A hydrolase